MLIHDFIPDLLNSGRRSEKNRLDGASLSRMNSNTAGFGGPPTPVFTQPGRNGEFPFHMMMIVFTVFILVIDTPLCPGAYLCCKLVPYF